MQGPVCLGREAQRCQQGVKPGDRISGCSVLWLPVASSHAHFPELDHLVPPPTSQPFADPGRMAEEFQAEDLELETVEHAAGEEGEGEDATAVRGGSLACPWGRGEWAWALWGEGWGGADESQGRRRPLPTPQGARLAAQGPRGVQSAAAASPACRLTKK